MPISDSTGPQAAARVAFPLPAHAAAPRKPASPAAHAAPGSAAAPANVSLWSALSEDERAFFLDVASGGPLTYGARAQAAESAQPPAPLGQRLDLRA